MCGHLLAKCEMATCSLPTERKVSCKFFGKYSISIASDLRIQVT